MKKEIWKPIPGFSNYEVSTLGRLRSLDRYTLVTRLRMGRISTFRTLYKGKILSGCIMGSPGYYLCSKITDDTGLKRAWAIHRLVAQTFHPNPENKPEVNHIDGNKLNNRADNLEWCTPKENSNHAVRIGLNTPCKGTMNGMAKLTEVQVIVIKEALDLGHRERAIAEYFKMSIGTINNIKLGKGWSHVTKVEYKKAA